MRKAILISLLFFVFGAFATSSFCQPQTQPGRASKKDVTSYTLPPEKYHKAVEYSKAKYSLYFISCFCGLILLLILLALKIAPRFRNLAERVSSNRFAQAWIFVPLL